MERQPPEQAKAPTSGEAGPKPPASASIAPVPPRRSYPALTSAEKSLFPNSMPVRQTLPSIHSFSSNNNSAPQPSSAQSPQPPSLNYSRQSQPPPTDHSKQNHQQQQQHSRYSSSASPYGAASLPPLSGSGMSPSGTTPTPPIIPPAASPKLSAAPPTDSGPRSAGSPPLSRPSLPGINQISPRLSSAAQPLPNQNPQQPQQGRDVNAAYGQGSGGARRNPMSVSSMLSGPPRASGITAYTPSSSGPPQPPVLPPMATSIESASKPTGQRAGSEQEMQGGGQARSPILSRPTASGSNLPSFRPPSNHEVQTATPKATSPALEKKEISAATSSSTPQPPKPAYPSLPSAFARESPYSTAPSATSTQSVPPPSQQQQAQQPQQSQQNPSHPQANKPPPAQPFFPNLAGYRPPPFPSQPAAPLGARQPPYGSPSAPSGNSAPASGVNTPHQQQQQGKASFAWQQQGFNGGPPQQSRGSPKLEHAHAHSPHSHPHSSHSHSHSHSSHSHSHAQPQSHTHSHSHVQNSATAPPPQTNPGGAHQHSHSHPAHSHPHSHPIDPRQSQGGHSHSHSHSHSHTHASNGGAAPGHARRPSAAGSIANSPQANRTPGGGLVAKPSPATTNGASGANPKGNGTSSSTGAGAGARFSSLMDGPYGQSIRENGPGIINKPPNSSAMSGAATTSNGTPTHHAQQPPQKRRRSETTATIAPPLPPTSSVSAQPSAIPKFAPRASPSLPPTPAPPPPPPFTHTDLRLATIRPPLVSIDNSAVALYLSSAAARFAKAGQPRPFFGRKLYDPFTSPASLLDGPTLRTCVGGTLELVLPTSLLLSPPQTPSNGLMTTTPIVHSSCSVPPIQPPPIALSFGPPSSYLGQPLESTSPTTPLSLPPHLFDLPFIKNRSVWGTDVYTDDSDLLGVLLHSGWVRLARRERKLRAGEKGAGEEAIRRAREKGPSPNIRGASKKGKKVSEVINEVAKHETEDQDGDGEEGRNPPKNLLITFGIVPAMIRYQGLERGGIRSRSWGNGHDGVSLRVEAIEPFDDTYIDRGRKTLRRHSSITSRQLSLDRKLATNPFPHSFLPPPNLDIPNTTESFTKRELEEPTLYPRLGNAKRFKFANSSADNATTGEHFEVSDTFTVDFLTGKGKFVGLENGAVDGEKLQGTRRIEEDQMQVEL